MMLANNRLQPAALGAIVKRLPERGVVGIREPRSFAPKPFKLPQGYDNRDGPPATRQLDLSSCFRLVHDGRQAPDAAGQPCPSAG
jgi:hypothetical protein